MSTAEVTSVAYKKGNWLRYILWTLAVICVGLLTVVFVNMMKGSTSASAPVGYKFALVDNVTDGQTRTTYYIYDARVIVENANTEGDTTNREALVYDNIDTSSLAYDAENIPESEECESLDNCATNRKLISSVKKLISHQASREYTGY